MELSHVRRLLIRAEWARRHLMQPSLAQIGLTFGQGHARILDVLLAEDHLTQKELSTQCRVDAATMSRSLDKLEEAGYLRREKDPECRRSYLICLTEEGIAEAKRVRQVLDFVDHTIWEGINPKEMESFCQTLEKICENLEECQTTFQEESL